MDLIWRYLLRLVAGVILFSNFAYAVCPGNSRETSLAGYALSPDASHIAAIARDGTLFWWEVASGKRTQLTECVEVPPFDAAILFSPDSNRIAVANNKAVDVFDIGVGKRVARLAEPKLKGIYAIAFSGDGRRLAASHEDGVAVWAIETQAEIAFLPARPTPQALALNLDGTLLVLGAWGGIELWKMPADGAPRRFAEGLKVESVLFAHQDQWLVALTAAALPVKPKQRRLKYERGIAVWDSTTGKKLRSFTGTEFEELRFGLESAGTHLLFGSDFRDRLLAWDLDTGKLKASWTTRAGHPSVDGKLLLRQGGAPGRLELWEIGGPDETAREFIYRSPLCAESFLDEKGDPKFDHLFIADGTSDDDQPFGTLTTYGYVARDCTRVNVTRLKFGTEERASRELDREIAAAEEVLETGPPKDHWEQALLGERRVLRFPRQGFAVIWLEGSTVFRIDSASLPVALAMEKDMQEEK